MCKSRVIATGAMAIALLALAASVYARDALFLGLTDNKGEPAHQQLESAIRHELSTNPNLRIIGEIETQRILREMERQGRKRSEAWAPPNAKMYDSLIIVRGEIEEYSINIKRRWLAWGKIEARMTVKMSFRELSGPSSYQGRFSATASKTKDFVMFGNPQKIVHISAVDRSELLSDISMTIVRDISEFAGQWIGAMMSGPVHKKEDNAVADTGTARVEEDELMTEDVE